MWYNNEAWVFVAKQINKVPVYAKIRYDNNEQERKIALVQKNGKPTVAHGHLRKDDMEGGIIPQNRVELSSLLSNDWLVLSWWCEITSKRLFKHLFLWYHGRLSKTISSYRWSAPSQKNESQSSSINWDVSLFASYHFHDDLKSWRNTSLYSVLDYETSFSKAEKSKALNDISFSFWWWVHHIAENLQFHIRLLNSFNQTKSALEWLSSTWWFQYHFKHPSKIAISGTYAIWFKKDENLMISRLSGRANARLKPEIHIGKNLMFWPDIQLNIQKGEKPQLFWWLTGHYQRWWRTMNKNKYKTR